jgi:hypothetical protein
VLEVQRKAWLHGSRSWQAGRRRGGSGGGGQGVGVHMAQLRVAWGGGCAAHGRRSGGGASGREIEEEGTRGRRRGLKCKSPKVQGLHCKAWITFKP